MPQDSSSDDDSSLDGSDVPVHAPPPPPPQEPDLHQHSAARDSQPQIDQAALQVRSVA